MGWAIGFDDSWNRDIGYGVIAFCDHPKCDKVIDRGLAFVCGGDAFGGERGCGLFFCHEHLRGYKQLCIKCFHSRKDYYKAKPDHPKWTKHKMTHHSWKKWREYENLRHL